MVGEVVGDDDPIPVKNHLSDKRIDDQFPDADIRSAVNQISVQKQLVFLNRQEREGTGSFFCDLAVVPIDLSFQFGQAVFGRFGNDPLLDRANHDVAGFFGVGTLFLQQLQSRIVVDLFLMKRKDPLCDPMCVRRTTEHFHRRIDHDVFKPLLMNSGLIALRSASLMHALYHGARRRSKARLYKQTIAKCLTG